DFFGAPLRETFHGGIPVHAQSPEGKVPEGGNIFAGSSGNEQAAIAADIRLPAFGQLDCEDGLVLGETYRAGSKRRRSDRCLGRLVPSIIRRAGVVPEAHHQEISLVVERKSAGRVENPEAAFLAFGLGG